MLTHLLDNISVEYNSSKHDIALRKKELSMKYHP